VQAPIVSAEHGENHDLESGEEVSHGKQASRDTRLGEEGTQTEKVNGKARGRGQGKSGAKGRGKRVGAVGGEAKGVVDGELTATHYTHTARKASVPVTQPTQPISRKRPLEDEEVILTDGRHGRIKRYK
jgi:hypothetical protein